MGKTTAKTKPLRSPPSAFGRQNEKTKLEKRVMEEGEFECWIDVPGTKGILQVSNRGRLRRLARKTKRGRSIVVVFTSEDVRLVCDYKTSRFGWWVYFDGEKHFFARDDLEALFPEGFRNVDRSADTELKRLRDETFVEDVEINGRSRKAGGVAE